MNSIMAAEDGFDELEMKAEKWEKYNDEELSEYFNNQREKREKLYKKYGDNDDTPEDIRVKYEKYDEKICSIEEERDRRENYSKDLFSDVNNRSAAVKKNDYSWIDDDINYKKSDLQVVRDYGTKDNIANFINKIANKNVTYDERIMYSKFLRSYLALTDGNKIRPLLNNVNALEIIKNTSFARGGPVKISGLTTTLTYKGMDVREINTTKGLVKN